jgi:hypothetical protein
MDTVIFVQQMESVISDFQSKISASKYDDGSDVISNTEVRQFQIRAMAAIERTVGRGSVYYEKANAVLDENAHSYDHLASIIGITESLLIDMKSGYLKSLEELIHSDVFSNFLEMADHLNSSGYKDAAAVIAGSTLESHLKNLAIKHSVPIESSGKPKKADAINSDLVKANSYTKLDQKNITAWLDLRNKAAHGNYAEYDKQQVALLISCIRDFLTRTPA